MVTSNRTLPVLWAVAAWLGLPPSTSRAETELVTHTVGSNGSTGMCAGDPLSNANSDDDYFDNGFTGYTQIEHWSDLAVDGRDFADNGLSWGDDDIDPYGTDFADVIFFSGHAGVSCTAGAERVWLKMGDDGETCDINLAHQTASSRHVTWGGSVAGEEADAFVNFACQTAHYCAFTAGAYDGMSQGQFNILNGFHGLVEEVASYQSDLASYSTNATSNYIGDAWLDWMYSPVHTVGTDDNCPSAVVFGANSSEIDDFYTYAGWNDFHDNGARTTNSFYYVCGCDPTGGVALPGC